MIYREKEFIINKKFTCIHDGIRFWWEKPRVNSEKNIYLFRDFMWNVLYKLFDPKKKCE